MKGLPSKRRAAPFACMTIPYERSVPACVAIPCVVTYARRKVYSILLGR